MVFPAPPKRPHFCDQEKEVLNKWDKEKTFQQSVDQRPRDQSYVFFDGPPFATGMPHYGNLLHSITKDIVCRYWTMKGKRVERRFGWDCHGLPIEFEIEKKLNLSGKLDIEKYGIDRFCEECRSVVNRYTKQWQSTITRLGRWVDFDDEYRTMDPEYMESVWWVFKTLFEKNQIYEGYRVQPYCPRCTTTLSNFETNLGYLDRQDPSVIVTFPLVDQEASLLAWTTTPWTLPSNAAVVVGPDIDYVKAQGGDDPQTYILAKARAQAVLGDDCQILESFKGSDLVGKKYQPLFSYFEGESENLFQVVGADFVSTDDGTGLVHCAPAFGEDDFIVGKKNNLPVLDPLDDAGCFTERVPEFQGQACKDADKAICRHLKQEGRLFDQKTLNHSYPHCYRCDTPLIYRAQSTWFVRVEPIKDELLKHNQNIHWVPQHVREGRMGKWLENARDWNIARNRYWGSPLPLWRCSQGHLTCIGSCEELEALSGDKVTDLHKHFVDKIKFNCPECGEQSSRIPEVLDCWFESGSMPYAQNHYPFENKDYVEQNFPADFITEALEQTRCWFYNLMVLGQSLFEKAPFRNCVCTGLILAEDGKKMSKHLKNFTDPNEVLEQYGADPFRLVMINAAVIRGGDTRFADSQIADMIKQVMLPLWNAYSFFLTYAHVDGWQPGQTRGSTNELDGWILSRLQSLLKTIEEDMAAYELSKVVPSLLGFIDELTNWYIRRSRRRFWKSESDSDKDDAYATLYQVLTTFSKALSPFLPFITETMYQTLVRGVDDQAPTSVHLCDYPTSQDNLIQTDLEQQMALVREVVENGRALRAQHNLKNRQPLASLTVATSLSKQHQDLLNMESLIREELNVKQVMVHTDESQLASFSARPNLPVLGKRCGAKLKALQPAIAQLSSDQIKTLMAGEQITLEDEAITKDDLLIDRHEKEGLVVSSGKNFTIALDTRLTDELKHEGMAREIINRVQNLRKEAGLAVEDRIQLSVESSDQSVMEALKTHTDLISSETLTVELLSHIDSPQGHQSVEIDGATVSLALSRVQAHESS